MAGAKSKTAKPPPTSAQVANRASPSKVAAAPKVPDIPKVAAAPKVPAPSGAVPTEGGARLSVSVALASGDLDEVARVTQALRDTGKRVDLANRLDALATLARGETTEALRALTEAAREAGEQGSKADQCRTRLALSVALSAAGRQEDALLEALRGLALAREGEDSRGERASAALIARLARGVGENDVAEEWERAGVASPSS